MTSTEDSKTYRQKFRTVTIPAGENPAETYHRLKGLYRRWIRPEQHTKEQIGEQIILEQLLRVFPADIRTWVKEHKPTQGLAAAKLAQQYLNARRGGPAPYQGGPGRQTPAQTSSARVHTQQSADSNHAASQRGPVRHHRRSTDRADDEGPEEPGCLERGLRDSLPGPQVLPLLIAGAAEPRLRTAVPGPD
uniref:SCAN box domain-containing protein n=1 Tax=Knipowitschia caucasica TaxID=637954 RepID=A0AAV2K1P5_KNICA